MDDAARVVIAGTWLLVQIEMIRQIDITFCNIAIDKYYRDYGAKVSAFMEREF